MKNLLPIPKFLSHLKEDHRGYPVPFFIPWKDGEPQWLFSDPRKQILCQEKKLCWVCGKKLGKPFYFITGPQGLINRAASDCPMHRGCAKFSLHVCPHMFYEKSTRRTDDLPAQEYMAREKPETLHLIKSDKYKVIPHPDGNRLMQYRVLDSIPFHYDKGVITPNPIEQ